MPQTHQKSFFYIWRLLCLLATLCFCIWMIVFLPGQVFAVSSDTTAPTCSQNEQAGLILNEQTRSFFETQISEGVSGSHLPIPKVDSAESETAMKGIDPQLPLSVPLQNHLQQCCEDNQIPVSLALAVIQVESNFQLDAENNGSVGLMQLNGAYAEVFEEKYDLQDLENAYDNLTGGISFLGDLCQKYPLEQALMVYNLGEGGMLQATAKGIYRTAYVDRVLQAQQNYEALDLQ